MHVTGDALEKNSLGEKKAETRKRDVNTSLCLIVYASRSVKMVYKPQPHNKRADFIISFIHFRKSVIIISSHLNIALPYSVRVYFHCLH